MANITIDVTVAQVVWADPEFNRLNFVERILTGSGMNQLIMNYLMLSLDLTLNEVQVSNAGVYTCGTIINDSLDDSARIERQYTLTVESKSLFINNIDVITIVIINYIPSHFIVYINTHNSI